MKALQKRQTEEIQSELRRKIGSQLRNQYDSVVTDELPPNIEDLLRRLDMRLY
jgi:hypothetical protein